MSNNFKLKWKGGSKLFCRLNTHHAITRSFDENFYEGATTSKFSLESFSVAQHNFIIWMRNLEVDKYILLYNFQDIFNSVVKIKYNMHSVNIIYDNGANYVLTNTILFSKTNIIAAWWYLSPIMEQYIMAFLRITISQNILITFHISRLFHIFLT